ncbi:MAG: hypothetical protein M1830_010433 [Pleopsidium flavum]|nr:MAG: hypothetical protein M1830_010433 [Pleopsidium flavum]
MSHPFRLFAQPETSETSLLIRAVEGLLDRRLALALSRYPGNQQESCEMYSHPEICSPARMFCRSTVYNVHSTSGSPDQYTVPSTLEHLHHYFERSTEIGGDCCKSVSHWAKAGSSEHRNHTNTSADMATIFLVALSFISAKAFFNDALHAQNSTDRKSSHRLYASTVSTSGLSASRTGQQAGAYPTVAKIA